MNDLKEDFLDWLRDAHAMEEQAETMLGKMIDRVGDYPILQSKLRQHLDETKHQAKLVEGCIEKLGSSASGMKDMAAKVMGFGQAISGIFVEDEVVKGVMASYVFENMEISAYTSLIAAANQLDELEIKSILESILVQEKEMAKWLLDYTPEITVQYLHREA
jgi:ferritin-like metal-binding protein YciE